MPAQGPLPIRGPYKALHVPVEDPAAKQFTITFPDGFMQVGSILTYTDDDKKTWSYIPIGDVSAAFHPPGSVLPTQTDRIKSLSIIKVDHQTGKAVQTVKCELPTAKPEWNPNLLLPPRPCAQDPTNPQRCVSAFEARTVYGLLDWPAWNTYWPLGDPFTYAYGKVDQGGWIATVLWAVVKIEQVDTLLMVPKWCQGSQACAFDANTGELVWNVAGWDKFPRSYQVLTPIAIENVGSDDDPEMVLFCHFEEMEWTDTAFRVPDPANLQAFNDWYHCAHTRLRTATAIGDGLTSRFVLPDHQSDGFIDSPLVFIGECLVNSLYYNLGNGDCPDERNAYSNCIDTCHADIPGSHSACYAICDGTFDDCSSAATDEHDSCLAECDDPSDCLAACDSDYDDCVSNDTDYHDTICVLSCVGDPDCIAACDAQLANDMIDCTNDKTACQNVCNACQIACDANRDSSMATCTDAQTACHTVCDNEINYADCVQVCVDDGGDEGECQDSCSESVCDPRCVTLKTAMDTCLARVANEFHLVFDHDWIPEKGAQIRVEYRLAVSGDCPFGAEGERVDGGLGCCQDGQAECWWRALDICDPDGCYGPNNGYGPVGPPPFPDCANDCDAARDACVAGCPPGDDPCGAACESDRSDCIFHDCMHIPDFPDDWGPACFASDDWRGSWEEIGGVLRSHILGDPDKDPGDQGEALSTQAPDLSRVTTAVDQISGRVGEILKDVTLPLPTSWRQGYRTFSLTTGSKIGEVFVEDRECQYSVRRYLGWRQIDTSFELDGIQPTFTGVPDDNGITTTWTSHWSGPDCTSYQTAYDDCVTDIQTPCRAHCDILYPVHDINWTACVNGCNFQCQPALDRLNLCTAHTVQGDFDFALAVEDPDANPPILGESMFLHTETAYESLIGYGGGGGESCITCCDPAALGCGYWWDPQSVDGAAFWQGTATNDNIPKALTKCNAFRTEGINFPSQLFGPFDMGELSKTLTAVSSALVYTSEILPARMSKKLPWLSWNATTTGIMAGFAPGRFVLLPFRDNNQTEGHTSTGSGSGSGGGSGS